MPSVSTSIKSRCHIRICLTCQKALPEFGTALARLTMDTDSLLHVPLGTDCRQGISLGTDDAKPANHFAQEFPSPTVLLE